MIGASPIAYLPIASEDAGEEIAPLNVFDFTGQTTDLELHFLHLSGTFDLVCELPGFSMFAGSSVVMESQAPTLKLWMSRSEQNSLTFDCEAPTLEMSFGARIEAEAQNCEVVISGTVPGVLRMDFAGQRPELEVWGLAGSLTRFYLASSSAELVLHGGLAFDVSSQVCALSLSASADGRMGFDLTSLRPLLSLSLNAEAVLRFDLTCLPMEPVPGWLLDWAAGLPSLEMAFAEIHTAFGEAYAINLMPGEAPYAVTRYTRYPFLRILRYRGRHYGVAHDGLYLLGGETDVDETIVPDFLTHPTDFESMQKKSPAAAYVGGLLGPKALITVVALGQGTYRYPYTTVRSGEQSYRIKFGRGLRTRYYAFGLSDADGGEMAIDSIDIPVAELSRAI